MVNTGFCLVEAGFCLVDSGFCLVDAVFCLVDTGFCLVDAGSWDLHLIQNWQRLVYVWFLFGFCLVQTG